MLDRNNTSLAYWNRKMLSRSDQVQRLMPIYTLLSLWVIKGICDKINSCINQFIWGENASRWVK